MLKWEQSQQQTRSTQVFLTNLRQSHRCVKYIFTDTSNTFPSPNHPFFRSTLGIPPKTSGYRRRAFNFQNNAYYFSCTRHRFTDCEMVIWPTQKRPKVSTLNDVWKLTRHNWRRIGARRSRRKPFRISEVQTIARRGCYKNYTHFHLRAIPSIHKSQE